jgi:multiple sugar transport system permease protein
MIQSNYLAKKFMVNALIFFLLFLFICWTIIPVYLVMSNSLKKTLEIKAVPPKVLFKPTTIHYERLLSLDRFGIYFMNSIIISVSVTVLSIIFGSMAAYGLKISRSRIGRRISNVLLLGKMVPSITILIPLFIIMNRIHLTGTYFAPILTLCSIQLPFVTWLMTGFIADIPNELLESASMMGCSRLKIFPLIIMPMLKPPVASAVILVMQDSWNELLFSLQLTNVKTYPLTVGITRYVGAVSVDWGKCSAAATIAVVPIIMIGFLLQKYLVNGMTSGAVKG